MPRVGGALLGGEAPVEQTRVARQDVAHAGAIEPRRRRPDEREVEHHEFGDDGADVADLAEVADADRIGEAGVDGGDRGHLHQRATGAPRDVLGGVERGAATEADHRRGRDLVGVGRRREPFDDRVEMGDVHVPGIDLGDQ